MPGTEWLSVRFCLDRWTDGRKEGWVDGGTGGRMDGQKGGQLR